MSTKILIITGLLLSGCSASLHQPLPSSGNRATPLSFGLHVTPDPNTNPIQPPERFSGYHAATDFEVSEGEVDGDVPVYALCKGKVRYSGYAEGYGGLLIQDCTIQNQKVTVLYGHLTVSGLPREGSRLKPGDTIALLGADRSYDSGYNRKHLHLGIHKGRMLDLRGYVQNEKELEGYIDPQSVLSDTFIDLPIETPGEIPYWEKSAEENT